MVRVAVLGAAGFTGALAADILWRHPEFELTEIYARSDTGKRLNQLYPHYRVPLTLKAYTGATAELDVAVVAYPHGAAAAVVAELLAAGVRVVDLSADFRLRDLTTYENWYTKHPAPELLSQAVYGLPELNRAKIKSAKLVANPGCYPTATLLGLAPLARAGMIKDVIVDAKSGVSGAGRGLSAKTHFVNINENIFPYNVGEHRHIPEIEQELELLGAATSITFVPHLVPLDQGELVSCYVTPTKALTIDQVSQLYENEYASEQFIEVVDEAPGVRAVRSTNFCRISVHVDHTGRIIVFSAIDNLCKGASTQAVQNLNLMFGLPEGLGLL